ncbi:MAG: UDP-glucose/GDP-mannose dehydrogenase family protein [Bacillaceae bacterium]|nr:UDP-glucose/GDP-mannose dehydrogenase family protein [Bacillaceae bacterium]
MNVCVIGAGYVGLTTSAVLADFGHTLRCVDNNEDKIKKLNQGEIPIFEPGLEEMIRKNKDQLTFTSDLVAAVTLSSIIIIAVGTPLSKVGSTDLTYIKEVIHALTPLITSYKIIMTKSTVPLGTNEMIHKTFIDSGVSEDLFDVVSNPEFLREGTAVYDMQLPDKIVLGVKRPHPISTIQKLYRGIEAPYIITNLTGAEMIKYASNAFLALKISFINEIANICEAYKVDVTDVSLGLGTDPRIGPLFLQPGLGYGGSCLPKDLASLESQCNERNVTPYLLRATKWTNDQQVHRYLGKLEKIIPNYKNKKITIWGASFKPNTDDTRHSQAIKLIKRLVDVGCEVHVYDPVVSLSIPDVISHNGQYDSIKGSDILIIATEWEQFKNADWKLVKNNMNSNTIVDCRNCVQPREIESYGLAYIGVGRL